MENYKENVLDFFRIPVY